MNLELFVRTLHGLRLSEHLLDTLRRTSLQLLIKVDGDVKSQGLVRDRDTCILEGLQELTLLRLVAEIEGLEPDLRDEKLRHLAGVLHASLFINLYDLAEDGLADATLHLVVVVLLSLRDDLHTLTHMATDRALPREHHLCDELSIEGRAGIGGRRSTGDESLTDAPGLHEFSVNPGVVLVEPGHRLAPEHALDVQPEVVNHQPEVSSESLIDRVSGIVQLCLGGNPRPDIITEVLDT